MEEREGEEVAVWENQTLCRGEFRGRRAWGLTLLGAPLGSEDFVRRGVEEKINKIEEITAQRPNLQDPHTEFVLLRACLALPKIMYTLRTVDTTCHGHHLRKLDRQTREALTGILGVPLGQRQWDQAKLPVVLGGLGLKTTLQGPMLPLSSPLRLCQGSYRAARRKTAL